MPDTFKPLFNRHLLGSRMAGFDPALTDEQTRLVEDWVRAANDPAFRQEKKPHQGEFLLQIFSIPLKERSEWESALTEWQAEHQRHTAKLVDVKTEINDRVYKLYGLSDADIQLLEDHMKKTMIYYPLGEV